MQAVLSRSLEYALGFPSPAMFRENRMRTCSLRGTCRQRCRGVRTETTALLLAVGFPSEEPFAILASKADQTYINGRVAFEAAPKSPY